MGCRNWCNQNKIKCETSSIALLLLLLICVGDIELTLALKKGIPVTIFCCDNKSSQFTKTNTEFDIIWLFYTCLDCFIQHLILNWYKLAKADSPNNI